MTYWAIIIKEGAIMKKLLLALVITSLFISGCGKTEEEIEVENNLWKLKDQYAKLEQEYKAVQQDKLQTEKDILAMKTANDYQRYVLTLNISQSHFTLDITQHMKDAMNDIDMQIPVDKAFFDSVKEGQLLKNDFRMGSLLLRGSFGNWEVKVVKKEVFDYKGANK